MKHSEAFPIGTLNIRVLLLWISILFVAGVRPVSAGACCAAGAAGGGGASGGFSATPLLEDSEQYNFFLYGLMSRSLSFNGHEGDPLGTGGRSPFFLNNNLYLESTPESFSLADDDLQLSYGDFGYIPVWKPNILSANLAYRLSDELQTAISLYLGGRPDPAYLNGDGQIGIEELALIWTPQKVSGLTIRTGKILDTDCYSTIFDQLPLTYINMKGISAIWKVPFGKEMETGIQFSLGANLAGKATIIQEEKFLFKSTRARSYLYGKLFINEREKFGITAVAGMQSVGYDSTVYGFDFKEGEKSREFPSSHGWHAGLVITRTAPAHTHSIALNYLKGDASVGMYTPDYVLVDSERMSFSKDGSSLTNIVYWSDIKTSKFVIGTGLQTLLRMPSSTSVLQKNRNLNFTPFPDESSISADSLSLLNVPSDSILSLAAEHSFMVRGAVLSRYLFSEIFSAGCRLDYIHYLTPDAKANTQDLLRDEAMRPIPHPKYPGLQERLFVQSRWENEAVNALVFSPFLMLDFSRYGTIKLTYSQARYSKPVLRNGIVRKTHSGIAIATNILLSKKGFRNENSTVFSGIKLKTGESHLQKNETCPVMGNPVDSSLHVDIGQNRIYICCPSCADIIKKDPGKYLQKPIQRDIDSSK